MGKNKGSKRGTQDPDAPPPVLRDQGGLAAVARAMAAQAAAAAAIAIPEHGRGDKDVKDMKDAKGEKDTTEKKEKKEKKAKKEKKEERARDLSPPPSTAPESKDDQKQRKRDRQSSRNRAGGGGGEGVGGEDDGGDGDRAARKIAKREAKRGKELKAEEEDRETQRAAAKLAGDDDEDDRIIRSHRASALAAAAGGSKPSGSGGDDGLLAAAAALDHALTAALSQDFLTAAHVNAAMDSETDETLFRECGRIAARAALTVKRALRKSNALMGSKADAGLDAAASLADDLRMRAAPGGAGGAYGACRLWDSIAKHNAVVWGRARSAVDAAAEEDKLIKSAAAAAAAAKGRKVSGGIGKGGARHGSADGVENSCATGGDGGVTFDEYYRAAMVDAHGDDLDALRLGHASGRGSAAAAVDRTDVGIIMRAIQAGVDVVPLLQKELVLQFASLDELRELKSGGGEVECDDDGDAEEGGSDSDSDESSDDDSEQDDAVDYEITPAPKGRR